MRGKSAKDRRRLEAEARNGKYGQLTTQQKLDQLPANGANRQRAKLTAKLEKDAENKRADASLKQAEKAAKAEGKKK